MNPLLETTSSLNPNRQRVGELKRFIQHYLIYRSGLQYLVNQGVISLSTSESVFHDYLNETTGLFDDEYFALENIYHQYWEDDFLNNKELHKGCDCNFASISNIRNVSSLISDVKDLIKYLSQVKNEINELEEKGFVSGNSASDLFSTVLFMSGLDYSSYLDLIDIGWDKENDD